MSKPLSEPMRLALSAIARTTRSPWGRSTHDALERRGLVTKYHDEYGWHWQLTDAGREAITSE